MGKSHSLGQLTQTKKVYDLPESVKELEKVVGLGVLDITELLKHFGALIWMCRKIRIKRNN